MSKYMIAPGKAITTARGVVSEYQTIEYKDIKSVSIWNSLLRSKTIVEKVVKPVFDRNRSIELRVNSARQRSVTGSPARADVTDIKVITAQADKAIEDFKKAENPDENLVEKPEENLPVFDEIKPKRTRKKKEAEEIEEPAEETETLTEESDETADDEKEDSESL
jgi:hypothetical protein